MSESDQERVRKWERELVERLRAEGASLPPVLKRACESAANLRREIRANSGRINIQVLTEILDGFDGLLVERKKLQGALKAARADYEGLLAKLRAKGIDLK